MIITAPMRPPDEVHPTLYPKDADEMGLEIANVINKFF